jgi:hypothetical protein
MKILVKVRPSAKKELVEKVGQPMLNFNGVKQEEIDFYRIWVKEPAVDGKANEAVIRALAEHLKIPTSRVKIKSGHTSRQKVIEVI